MPDWREVHVRWRDDEWLVEVDGEPKPRSSHATRAAAWSEAINLAGSLGLEAVLHSRGGYVRDRALTSYELVCAECSRRSRPAENDEWRVFPNEVGELNVLCPECSRKFGVDA